IILNLVGPKGPINLAEYFSWSATQIEFVSMGLPIGAYSLNITIESSGTRVGCVSLSVFSITSTTQLEIFDESLTGLVSEQHSFVFNLKDSLDDWIEDVSVWLSIYNPTGREIYGSPLTDRTLVLSGSEVSWMPNLVGEYHVFLEFEGDSYLNETSMEFLVQIRYSSSLILETPELVEYGEVVPVIATLKGALGTISGATITLMITTDGIASRFETLTTSSTGIAGFNLVGLLSGNHTIHVSFDGSSTQAPCESELEILVTPLVVLTIEPISEMYVGHYCSLNLSVSVLGASSDWFGTLIAQLFDPDGYKVTEWTFQVGVHSVFTIGFNAQNLGTHSLNLTLTGLPVLLSQTYPMAVTIVDESLQFELDAGTSPLLGGFGMLAIIGAFLRKKLHGIVDSLPNEWME
ncbi:MAG: Ig-like domain-containing protein, partial [Promethearchaeota archaeon]